MFNGPLCNIRMETSGVSFITKTLSSKKNNGLHVRSHSRVKQVNVRKSNFFQTFIRDDTAKFPKFQEHVALDEFLLLFTTLLQIR